MIWKKIEEALALVEADENKSIMVKTTKEWAKLFDVEGDWLSNERVTLDEFLRLSIKEISWFPLEFNEKVNEYKTYIKLEKRFKEELGDNYKEALALAISLLLEENDHPLKDIYQEDRYTFWNNVLNLIE